MHPDLRLAWQHHRDRLLQHHTPIQLPATAIDQLSAQSAQMMGITSL